jgi:UMF1 family MFS transporter
MYDWANSAMVTVIVTSVYPIFFREYASAGISRDVALARHAFATSIALTIIAVLAPILGAMADHAPVKKRMLGGFLGLGVTAVALMFFIGQGQWLFAAVLFILANIGANGSFVFYDSLLPHVAEGEEIDRVSTAGYALGYLGGGVLLAIVIVVWLLPGAFGLPAGEGLSPEQGSLRTRVGFVAVAVWWALFAIPLFRTVPEPPTHVIVPEERRLGTVRAAFLRLRDTAGNLRRYRNAFLMLVAFLIYNDGIGTIIRMGTIYGETLELDTTALIVAILTVQFVGIPFAFLFGMLAGKIGAKRSIFLGLVVYVGISVLGYFMDSEVDFFVLAGLVGVVQGGTQALSRSLFGSMIPAHESGEFFGVFAIFEKFAGIAGPTIFGLLIAATGSPRLGILSVIAFFVVGGFILLFVDVDEGRRVAREEEARLREGAVA